MKNIPNWPTTAKSCLHCVHHTCEENGEEVEVLVCFLRVASAKQKHKLIEKLEQAGECVSYYTGSYE